MKGWFVSGIDTEVGKTIASAVLVKALGASYWKPVQAGDLDNSDSIKVARLAGNPTIFPEGYRLLTPMSPHAAASREGISIQPADFQLPETNDPLIVEGAGGLMVPINEDGFTMIDLIEQLKLPVILVSRHYLGSINHTLLSLETLKNKGIPVAGILWNGQENPETENIIERISGVQVLGRLPQFREITPKAIADAAAQIAPSLREKLLQHV